MNSAAERTNGALSRFGRTYAGEPDVIAEELRRDVAVRAADTLLLTVPNQLGVEYNARLLETMFETWPEDIAQAEPPWDVIRAVARRPAT